MKSFLAIYSALLIPIVFGTVTIANEAELSRLLFERVVNGNNADQHEWPWQISLLEEGSHICGGSLIRPDWVLTAAHCVSGNPGPSGYTVVVGAHSRTGTTAVQRSYNIRNIFEHEGFGKGHLRNDIALLQLERPVNLSKHVQMIKLPRQGDTVAVGTTCSITGWGRSEGGGYLAPILQEANLTIAEHQKCDRTNDNWRVDDATMLCAGGQGKGGCQGDSGGPLACQENGEWILRGVVSWGHAKCDTSHYTVFARVSGLVSWIDYILKNVAERKTEVLVDTDSRCPNWKRYCSVADIVKHCKKTCNTGHVKAILCEDSDGRCQGWKTYCIFPSATKECKKTCNRC